MALTALGVRFVPTTGGTANWTYSTTVTGYSAPSAYPLVDGAIYRYRAELSNLTQWEWGYGAWTLSSGVLARTTIAASSSAGAKVNFGSTPDVAIVIFPEDILQFDADMVLIAAQQAQARKNIVAAAPAQYPPSI